MPLIIRRSISLVAAAQSMRIETLPQQMQQRRSRFGLPFGGDVSSDRMGGALDWHAQDGVGVNIALADQTDRLSEDVQWAGSVGRNALHSADQFIHGSIRAIWHGARMPGHAADATPIDGQISRAIYRPSVSPALIAARIIALTAFWKSRRLLIAQNPSDQTAS
jgi:hypothetical protein